MPAMIGERDLGEMAGNRPGDEGAIIAVKMESLNHPCPFTYRRHPDFISPLQLPDKIQEFDG